MTYFSRGVQTDYSDAVCFGIKDGPDKLAALITAVNRGDPKKPPDKLILVFLDNGEWQKFARLWDAARHTRPPAAHDIEVGSYFDPAGQAGMTIYVEDDGKIQLAMAGEPGENNEPKLLSLFELAPADFESFDHDVESVTAYFRK
jgi:hypothetical protein